MPDGEKPAVPCAASAAAMAEAAAAVLATAAVVVAAHAESATGVAVAAAATGAGAAVPATASVMLAAGGYPRYTRVVRVSPLLVKISRTEPSISSRSSKGSPGSKNTEQELVLFSWSTASFQRKRNQTVSVSI
jgi:hypothetical protein